MYRCLNCNMPVALSWVSHHSCFLHQQRISIDEFNLIDGIQASANSDSAIEETDDGVCLNTQEEATHRIWNCVVAAMEHNQDMLRYPTDALSISRLNDSWVQLDEELFQYAEGTLDEWKTRWREKTTLKWEILKDTKLTNEKLDLFFSDAEKRLLHLMGHIKNFQMNVIPIFP
ncbi:uncharacterized protein [Venturia canescens]|uniref:uncharacterized protein n=1 Tax=Venturia canescens TaxID=32260 RepID=UPI001C9CAA8C|nr:uncharacterized protein LOC122409529 [Venturia canescens]